MASASLQDMAEVADIGERIAESVYNYLHQLEHMEELARLRAAGLNFQIEEKEVILAGNSLAGKTFLISGVFADFSREQLAALIESHGGKMVSSISAKLSYLVAGDKMGPSKLAKAEKLQVPILTDQGLLALINETN